MIYSSYRDRWCTDCKWIRDRLIYDSQFIDKYVFYINNELYFFCM